VAFHCLVAAWCCGGRKFIFSARRNCGFWYGTASLLRSSADGNWICRACGRMQKAAADFILCEGGRCMFDGLSPAHSPAGRFALADGRERDDFGGRVPWCLLPPHRHRAAACRGCYTPHTAFALPAGCPPYAACAPAALLVLENGEGRMTAGVRGWVWVLLSSCITMSGHITVT